MPALRRFLAVLHARNIEFVRDRSALAWNVVLPTLLVFGMALIFSGPSRPLFKVAVLGPDPSAVDHPFLATRYVQFIPAADEADALAKLARHQLDMVMGRGVYWVNPDSPKGYLVERLLLGAGGPPLERASVSGAAVRYVDWLAPGVLGMNMMFSCLFGVGFVVVRYRKTGFLKRLNATPLGAVEFVAAQIASRLLLILAVTVGVFTGLDLLLDLRMEGSFTALALVAAAGATAMIALGFLVAARVTSEEVANGLLNLISWPMMLLSGVWFSLEGAPAWIRGAAELLPLTQLLKAARAIMIDGAGLAAVSGPLAALVAMAALFLAAGAWTFRWRGD